MTIWTVEDVLALRPCEDYDRERLTNLWDGRDALAIAEVCDLDIPAEDRLWLLCKAPFASIEPAITAIVTRAVTTHALGPHETRTWAEKWLSGEDRTSDAAYAVAARAYTDAYAYDYVAVAAAVAAAYAAAYAADVAYAAAYAADAAARAAYAYAAADAAATHAAAAEREIQIEDFRALSLARRIRREPS